MRLKKRAGKPAAAVVSLAVVLLAVGVLWGGAPAWASGDSQAVMATIGAESPGMSRNDTGDGRSNSVLGEGTQAPPQSDPAAAAAMPVWKVSLWKTMTYRVAASIDALIVGFLYTGSLFGGGSIALLNAVISSTLYDLHEVAWNKLGPEPGVVEPVQLGMWKTVSYRMISIANVLLTGLAFTGNLLLSTGLALGNAAIDSTIYFFHELAWVYWGPPVERTAMETN